MLAPLAILPLGLADVVLRRRCRCRWSVAPQTDGSARPQASTASSSATRSSRRCAPSNARPWRRRQSSSARSSSWATIGASSTSRSSRRPRGSRPSRNVSQRPRRARAPRRQRGGAARLVAAAPQPHRRAACRVAAHRPRRPSRAPRSRAEDALQSVRSAMVLGAVLPEIRQQAEILSADLGELVRLRKEIAQERDKLARDLFVLADERQRLSLLIEERQKRQSEAEQALGSRARACPPACARGRKPQCAHRRARAGADASAARAKRAVRRERREKGARRAARSRRAQAIPDASPRQLPSPRPKVSCRFR